MASAYSWPIRQETYADSKEAFFEMVDKLVNELGYSMDESSPDPWRANSTLVADADYVVLGNPGTGSPSWQMKLTYKTDAGAGGADPGFWVSLSPEVTANVAYGTNPTTTASAVTAVRLGAGPGSVRLTTMGTDSTVIVISEYAGGVVDVMYVGRYEPFEASTYDPYPVALCANDLTDFAGEFVTIEDPTGTPAELDDGFLWIPTRGGADGALSPLKPANIRNTASLNYKQKAAILEVNDGTSATVRTAGRLSGVYLMTWPPAVTNWGEVWGSEGAYVIYLGYLFPWPDSTPGGAYLS